ncbi:translocation and assembly module lipoprotein TamL [Mesonia aquimarina]|uniref:translocation and assembly module lipoprotein TamL n=1 Tax=Mesonia aquimarina TaxID=1504967 RepID=UPI000EF5C1B8|nr:BamA/TamA family outer membrane protein [Mesonia aquimarina]
MQSKKITYSLFLFCFVLFYSCSVKKFIPEDELLYTGADVKLIDTLKIKNKTGLTTELNNLLVPKPNSKVLGMRLGLYFHYKAQREKPGFINKFLNKKIGEEPVYFSEIEIPQTEDLIQNRLGNNGFFNSQISSAVKKDSAAKQAKVNYEVALAKPYTLEKFQLEKDTLDSLAIYKAIEASFSKSIIKKGMRFNLDAMKAERNRIDDYLKSKGYYNFNGDFLIFEADTNRYSNRRFDLFLKLKKNVPEKSLVPYLIDEVNVFPNASVAQKNAPRDTTIIDSIKFIQEGIFFKPKHLEPYLLIKPGDRYSPKLSKYTSRRLSSISTYKFVNIQYEEVDSVTDENGFRHLKSTIDLSPLNKRSIRLRLEGVTKSNNFTGPGIGVTYANRNLFKGGELLRLSSDFGFEKQFFGSSNVGNTSIQLGFNSSLIFPRLLFPINADDRFKYSIPKTKIDLGVDYLDRTDLYKLNSISTSFGYIWAANKFVTHELNLINIDFVNLGDTSEEFEMILDENPFLRKSFEQEFIAGLTYSFTYNELGVTQKRGSLYFNFNFDIAGNTIDLFSKENSEGTNTFLGLAYAQYAKTDIDFRYHYKLGKPGNVLVGRLFGGVGLPYGNSEALPFVKQYFSGGPYSVRAFRIRSLGPGTYKPEDPDNSYFDQAGDIRLEGNVEYRFPIFEYLNGAIFADAGNVWLMKENEALPGGKFSSNFINELGVGTGIGLRIDIQGFVIRFDLASPLKRPAEKWEFEYDKPVFNFAIGYPF